MRRISIRDPILSYLPSTSMRWIGSIYLFVTSFCMTFSAFGQEIPRLDEPKARELSMEEEVDQAFGSVVSAMENVLLWDVIFWDNEPELSGVASRNHKELPIEVAADPLGWGFFIRDKSGASLIDYYGEEQKRFEWEGTSLLEQMTITPDGQYIFLTGEGRIQRHFRGIYDEVKQLYLPSGATLTSIKVLHLQFAPDTQANPMTVFGASDGNIYYLDAEANFKIVSLHAQLDDAVVAFAQRQDGAYWAAASRYGEIEIYDPRLKGRIVGRLSIDVQAHGQIKELGFAFYKGENGEPADQRLWVRTDKALTAWDLVKSEELFSPIHFRELRSVKAIEEGFLLLSDGVIRKIQSDGLLPGVEVSSRQFQDARAFDLYNGEVWVTTKGGSVRKMQLKNEDGIPFGKDLGLPTPEPLIATDTSVLFSHSGGRLITVQGGKVRVWHISNLNLPLVVLWLVLGAIFFTIKMRFVNVRMFKHAIDVVRGKYDDPESDGEVSHFQALTSALSATVGLGNIAGVAIAVSLGGPGATFWMIMAGFLGMASKFTECTLGQKYRKVQSDGHVMGGAMHYLSVGLATERGWAKTGKVLAVLFAFLCVGGSFGGGNAFQVKQSLGALKQVMPFLDGSEWAYGLLMMAAVGVVILGGIKSIARTAEKIVPVMCGLYILAALYIILANLTMVPHAVIEIMMGAFAPNALYGGFIGVLVVGFQRAAFSNEAGIGSAAIAHAAAKTAYPVREGIVALLEPFIDTIVVCTMTALVIVITGAYHNPEYGAMIAAKDGAALTSQAMGDVISFAPYVLSVAVALFAYSTMISWSYYGERCWAWLFGEEAVLVSMGPYSSLIYRALFLVFVFLGSIMTASNILGFSDLMILGMAFPNIFGLIALSKGVKADLDTYVAQLEAGELALAPVVSHESSESTPASALEGAEGTTEEPTSEQAQVTVVTEDETLQVVQKQEMVAEEVVDSTQGDSSADEI